MLEKIPQDVRKLGYTNAPKRCSSSGGINKISPSTSLMLPQSNKQTNAKKIPNRVSSCLLLVRGLRSLIRFFNYCMMV